MLVVCGCTHVRVSVACMYLAKQRGEHTHDCEYYRLLMPVTECYKGPDYGHLHPEDLSGRGHTSRFPRALHFIQHNKQ